MFTSDFKKNRKNFKKMSYREVQSANSKNRSQLQAKEQQWLKENGYRNVGWDNVISLYQKIEEFLKWKNFSLEELFLEADRIGNKYLSNREIADFNQRLSQEVNEIAEEIDRQFPDTESEVVDYSSDFNNKFQRNILKSHLKLEKTRKR